MKKVLCKLFVALWVASLVAMIGVLLVAAVRENIILLLPVAVLAVLACLLVKLSRHDDEIW